jgi:DNA repair protein RecO (recombination protein O)
MPNLIGCDHCGTYESNPMYFLLNEGILLCKDCISAGREQSFAMEPGVLTALRHTIYADFEKLFSFSLQPEGLRQLSKISEAYVIRTVERRIPTLEFYHHMVSMGEKS